MSDKQTVDVVVKTAGTAIRHTGNGSDEVPYLAARWSARNSRAKSGQASLTMGLPTVVKSCMLDSQIMYADAKT